jgi:ribosome-associated toxin RatA of RatAB toxin-antitoxin module
VENRTYSSSVIVRATPEAVYDLVSDVTRTGEWSPQCRACWWDEGDGPRVGAWFTGRNEVPARSWETRSQVVAADRGREFAWVVGGKLVRWSFSMEPVDEGTRLTESWEFLQAGIEFFHERYGEAAEEQIADRTQAAHAGIPQTLDAIRKIAEVS